MSEKSLPPDLAIYQCLLGPTWTLGKEYRSPIPKEVRGSVDKSPSFAVFKGRDGKLHWKDHGYSNAPGSMAVDLWMAVRNVSYREAIHQIRSEVTQGMVYDAMSKREDAGHELGGVDRVPIIAEASEWSEHHLRYMDRIHLNQEDLAREWIYPGAWLAWQGSDKIADKDSEKNPMFVYRLQGDNGVIYPKAYFPLHWNKKRKFRNGFPKGTSIIEGWHDFPEQTDFTLICGSTKDRAVWKKGGIPAAINATGESTFYQIVENLDEIKRRSKFTVIVKDGDSAGLKGAMKLSQMTGFPYIDAKHLYGVRLVNDKVEVIKDPADAVDKENIDPLTLGKVNLTPQELVANLMKMIKGGKLQRVVKK